LLLRETLVAIGLARCGDRRGGDWGGRYGCRRDFRNRRLGGGNDARQQAWPARPANLAISGKP
jgi:hypothetical protein